MLHVLPGAPIIHLSRPSMVSGQASLYLIAEHLAVYKPCWEVSEYQSSWSRDIMARLNMRLARQAHRLRTRALEFDNCWS